MPYKDKNKQREFQKLWIRNRRKELILDLGGKCSQCGSTDKLEFDHVEPEKKSYNIAGLISTPSKLKSEIQKCQILCKPCHIDKTMGELGFKHTKQHGSRWAYRILKCRCDLCVSAHAAKKKKWQQKNGAAYNAKRRLARKKAV